MRECGSGRYNVFLFDEPWVGDYFWLIKRAFHKYIEVSTAISAGTAVSGGVYSRQWRGVSAGTAISGACEWVVQAYDIEVPRPLFIKSWANCFRRGALTAQSVPVPVPTISSSPSSHYQFQSQFPLVPNTCRWFPVARS